MDKQRNRKGKRVHSRAFMAEKFGCHKSTLYRLCTMNPVWRTYKKSKIVHDTPKDYRQEWPNEIGLN